MPPLPDRYAGRDRAVMGPVIRRVVPAAWGTLTEVTRGIRANAAGNIEIRLVDESASIIEAFAAGELLPYRVHEIVEAGSTVALANIRLLY